MLLALITLTPTFVTQSVMGDADDPAIWVNPSRPAASRILGTDKKGNRLYVFDLDGKVVQTLGGLNRPNNVDILPGFFPGGLDLAMVTERDGDRLHAYRIDRRGRLTDVSGNLACKHPMGIALTHRGREAIAYVSPKKGPTEGYIGRYRLTLRKGRVDATLLDHVGRFDGGKEIESLAIDPRAGLLWYSDETFGNRAVVLQDGTQRPIRLNADYEGDHEGIAVWTRGAHTYRAFTNQIEGGSTYRVYDEKIRRRGEFTLGADSTDGIDACSRPLGPKFPKGIFVAMNSKGKNFLVIGLDRIEAKL